LLATLDDGERGALADALRRLLVATVRPVEQTVPRAAVP